MKLKLLLLRDLIHLLPSVCLFSLILSLILWFPVGSSGNLDWIKERAPTKWREQGFEIVGYEGYQWGIGGFGTRWGGAKVWHRLRKNPDNGISYTGYLYRWGEEIHVYNLQATDAIKP